MGTCAPTFLTFNNKPGIGRTIPIHKAAKGDNDNIDHKAPLSSARRAPLGACARGGLLAYSQSILLKDQSGLIAAILVAQVCATRRFETQLGWYVLASIGFSSSGGATLSLRKCVCSTNDVVSAMSRLHRSQFPPNWQPHYFSNTALQKCCGSGGQSPRQDRQSRSLICMIPSPSGSQSVMEQLRVTFQP